MRRNKEEMQEMRSLVNSYLLGNANDPQKAYNDYITYFLTNKIQLPYYVQGLKDFIKLSKDVAHNDMLIKESLKLDKEEQQKRESYKINFENFLSTITFEEVKDIWDNNKSKLGKDEKNVLMYLYMVKKSGEFNIKEFNNYDIMNLRSIFNN